MARTISVLAAVVAVVAGCGDDAPEAPEAPRPASVAKAAPAPVAPALRRLERQFDARLGVYAVDTGTGREVAYRARERFPFASTSKALAAGAILHRYGVEGLDREVPITSLAAAFSPVTERRVGTTMTLRELCAAAVRHSDNTAANLLLDRLGGPRGLEAVLRSLGDDVTRMDRREPELNDWRPGATRDTTTPRAIARDLRALVVGDALAPRARAQLARWLRGNTTGDALIRAGVPRGWRVGDKTGTGGTYGTRNDIAVVWRPNAAPLVLAIMTNRHEPEAEHDDRLLARAAGIVADRLG